MKKKFSKTPINAASKPWFTHAKLAEVLSDIFADDVYNAIDVFLEQRISEMWNRIDSNDLTSTDVLENYCVSAWALSLKEVSKHEGSSFSYNVALKVIQHADIEFVRELLSAQIRENFSDILDERTVEGILIAKLIFK